MLTFQRCDDTLTVRYDRNEGFPGLKMTVGPRFQAILPEQIPPGSIVRLFSYFDERDEVFTDVLFEGSPLFATTPTPAPIRPPTATPTPYPTSRPTPTPVAVHSSVAGYSALLAQAASSLPAKYDFVSDGLSAEEMKLLDWADSRLFSNPAFLESGFRPDNWPSNWPSESLDPGYKGKFTPSDLPSDSELRLASVQAVVLMMQEIDIQKRSDGKHVVSWGVDALDRILDDLGVYSGLCVHCYGKTGYNTREEVSENYGPLIYESGHGHREMLKAFAYYARADGEGILIRSFLENDADDLGLLHKRGRWHSPIAVGSFNYEDVSFMSQIRFPDGELVSYPTMVFGMAGDARTEREAVEGVYDYMRKKLIHFSGDLENFANLYRPYSVTPYSPELGWIVHVGEAGSPSASAVVTGALRVLGLKAEQFKSPKKFRAGSVEVDGETYYYDGNDPMGRNLKKGPICTYFRTLEQVDNQEYDRECDK